MPRENLDAGFLERPPRRLLVVDDEAEVRLLLARAALEEGDELIADLEKRRIRLAAVHSGRLEQRAVELDRRFQIVDLQRDVIDAREPRFRGPRVHSARFITSPPAASPARSK